MSHHVSISNSLLIGYNHHLLWLNSYLWQMQIPLLIDCDSKSPPSVLCAACDLSNTITQRCTAKTALTPFSMCHGVLSSLHLTFWRQTGAEEAAEETLIPNFSPCHYGPVRPPIRCLWVMWETLGPVLPTPAGQTACFVQTKLKTTRQTQLRFTSMSPRDLYACFVVVKREAWILISHLSGLASFLPLSPFHRT